MNNRSTRALGLALALTTTATAAFAQPVPVTHRTDAAPAPAAATPARDGVDMRYVGAPVVHVAGARDKLGYPELTYLQTSEQVQAFIDAHGPAALQELQDNDIRECKDIAEYELMVDALDQKIAAHENHTAKLQKQVPLHEGVQMGETVLGGGADVMSGVAAHSPWYVIGRLFGIGKQLGQDHWYAKLDDNHLEGEMVFAYGMRVFSAGDRVYAAHMKDHCALMANWTARYGTRVFAPVR